MLTIKPGLVDAHLSNIQESYLLIENGSAVCLVQTNIIIIMFKGYVQPLVKPLTFDVP